MWQIENHTDVTRWRKRLHRVGNLRLPFPMTGLQTAAAAGALAIMAFVLGVFHIKFGVRTWWLFAGPPVGAWHAVKADIIEGRSVLRWAVARVMWVLSPAVIMGVAATGIETPLIADTLGPMLREVA